MNINKIAGKYVGIPYKHAGRGMDGLDCLGLAHLFYRDCGIAIPDGDGIQYPPNWANEDKERYIRGILKEGKAVPVDKLEPLDFVYFKFYGIVSHAGVMVDSSRFLHVLERGTVQISRLSSSWRYRLAGARRFL
jgi:cell wall-associated NlpC family hydrolase